ncbi:MAG TPA: DUF928 domain-containing protein [Xenococcaceae cyanobacterium]|jgi:hypothetical protein
MNLGKNLVSQKLVFLIAVSSLPFWQLPLDAQDTTNSSSSSSFGASFEPPNRDKPVTTLGGASRGEQCVTGIDNSEVSLIPILPAIDQRLTIASHPTFLVHLPQTSAQQVFLTIQDENEAYSYQTILPISGESGIISVTLPETAPPLNIGKNYQWSIALICEEGLKPDSPIVQGSVVRVQAPRELTKSESAESSQGGVSLTEQSSQINPIEQANLYAEAGIWYETILTLAQLRKEQPDNAELQSIWEQILTSIGLNEIAKAEFVE